MKLALPTGAVKQGEPSGLVTSEAWGVGSVNYSGGGELLEREQGKGEKEGCGSGL